MSITLSTIKRPKTDSNKYSTYTGGVVILGDVWDGGDLGLGDGGGVDHLPQAEEGGGTQVAHENDDFLTVALGLDQGILPGSVTDTRVQVGTAADKGGSTGKDAIHHILMKKVLISATYGLEILRKNGRFR